MSLFTASKTQVTTYLLAVCPFSIAFLVFLNSSVSFVITDLIGQDKNVGDAVGNLGFADELVALVACPIWGLLSDRVGVRTVCFIGYLIIGVALFTFIQAKNVYPELLLGRLFFSLGGAAASTMVTALLPTMSFVEDPGYESTESNEHVPNSPIISEHIVTPSNRPTSLPNSTQEYGDTPRDPTSKIAGFVGMATGCGALIALSIFLPLPARFQKGGTEPSQALRYTYYVVGATALALAGVCLVGLAGLKSEKKKSGRFIFGGHRDAETAGKSIRSLVLTYPGYLYEAFLVGLTRRDIFIGYIGGFVARASSVAISLFIPLLVNAAFLSSGRCAPVSVFDDPSGLPDLKRRCPRAYVVAAQLTGVSQLVALLAAPLFGYWSSRLKNKNIPLMFSALCAIVGYPLLALRFDPNDEHKSERAVAFLAVCLIGIGQIGAIVVSLAILSIGVLRKVEEEPTANRGAQYDVAEEQEPADETPLLQGNIKLDRQQSLASLKGSIAGIYSFYGGAGILILTKAGGALFDSASRAAPFYMMAAFNGLLLGAAAAASIL